MTLPDFKVSDIEADKRNLYLMPLSIRLLDIFRRHLRKDDVALSDLEFVKAVHERFLKSREDYILDPSE